MLNTPFSEGGKVSESVDDDLPFDGVETKKLVQDTFG